MFILRIWNFRGEKSMLWFPGESVGPLQLSGYSRLCGNPQLPWPDAGRWALLAEAFLWGGSARGVHAAQPDWSRKAHKMRWDSGERCSESTLTHLLPELQLSALRHMDEIRHLWKVELKSEILLWQLSYFLTPEYEKKKSKFQPVMISGSLNIADLADKLQSSKTWRAAEHL